jgi:hypothetical protein
MKTIGICLLLLACAGAQQESKVSVQYAVISVASRAGLGYNWQKSFDQTDPACRIWVSNPPAESVPFATAMRQILDPVGLRYEVEDGKVVLYRATDLSNLRVNYYADKKSVQYIVIDLAQQVGLGYNWDKSFAATDPECRRFVYDVPIKDQPFHEAMADILDPVGLRYEVENGEVVLYLR